MTTKTMRFLFGRFLGKRVPIADCIALMICALFGLTSLVLARAPMPNAAHPGARSMMDAHNCYPYFGWWNDRIDRALSAGTPLAIEQDLLWYTDKRTGQSRSIVTHGVPSTGHEPSMKDYFFERVRPVVENALKSPDHHEWPLITLNLDFKSEEPEHLEAVWNSRYIEFVEITAAETVDDGSRGQFYDATGALRDMVPNHLFQLLALVGMEPPNSFDAEAVRDERAKLIAAIRPVSPENAVRGQYRGGKIDGRKLKPFTKTEDIDPHSRTETYAALRIEVESWRWSGVLQWENYSAAF